MLDLHVYWHHGNRGLDTRRLKQCVEYYKQIRGLARTVCMHRLWPYIWWFPCQKYRMYTMYIGFWPTLYKDDLQFSRPFNVYRLRYPHQVLVWKLTYDKKGKKTIIVFLCNTRSWAAPLNARSPRPRIKSLCGPQWPNNNLHLPASGRKPTFSRGTEVRCCRVWGIKGVQFRVKGSFVVGRYVRGS